MHRDRHWRFVMPPDRQRALAAALLGSVCAWSVAGLLAQNAPQSFEWQRGTPESQGMSSSLLQALRGDLEAKKSKGLLLIRNDTVVLEWYAPGHAAAKTHYT